MKDDCLFCQIANGDQEKLVWSNDWAVAFKDIHPKAPVHVLVVPKQHIESFDRFEDEELAGHLFMAVREVAHFLGLEGRWRVIINVGRGGGQLVDHLHLHVLGGKNFTHEEVEEAAD